jgi:hypothetical protein
MVSPLVAEHVKPGPPNCLAFAAATAKPLAIRDDLAVKVQVIDLVDPAPVIAQLEERAAGAAARLALFEQERLLVLVSPQTTQLLLEQGEPSGGPSRAFL